MSELGGERVGRCEAVVLRVDVSVQKRHRMHRSVCPVEEEVIPEPTEGNLPQDGREGGKRTTNGHASSGSDGPNQEPRRQRSNDQSTHQSLDKRLLHQTGSGRRARLDLPARKDTRKRVIGVEVVEQRKAVRQHRHRQVRQEGQEDKQRLITVRP